jgi:hypothetical protein
MTDGFRACDMVTETGATGAAPGEGCSRVTDADGDLVEAVS